MAMTFMRPIYALRLALVLLVGIAFSAAFYKVQHHPKAATFHVSERATSENVAPEFRTHFTSNRKNISVHASSLVELNDGRIRAFWFAGSREGAKDVEIVSAVFDPIKDTWSQEQSVVNRVDTERGLLRYVKKLGNPVAQRAPDGTLWLFYVTVSLGGWAGSSITALTSKDDGDTWSAPQRLITSPFINISTLIKGTPFMYSDGTMGLPVYHEFIGKFSELLRLSVDGEVIDKQRMSAGRATLQPVMMIQDAQQALVLMRRSGSSPARVIKTMTKDAGQHWAALQPSTLANPDAAISGAVLADGQMLTVLNNLESGRDVLSLAVSSDHGATWKSIYKLEEKRGHSTRFVDYGLAAMELAKTTDADILDEKGFAESAHKNKYSGKKCAFEFSYPYLIQAQNGDFHLVYTWNRSFIKHVWFNRAWLDLRASLAEKRR